MTKYLPQDGDDNSPIPLMPHMSRDRGMGKLHEFPAPTPPGKTVPVAGDPEDPRMKEALRLVEAFLAIEDAAARAALVTLADRMVSHDWLRAIPKR